MNVPWRKEHVWDPKNTESQFALTAEPKLILTEIAVTCFNLDPGVVLRIISCVLPPTGASEEIYNVGRSFAAGGLGSAEYLARDFPRYLDRDPFEAMCESHNPFLGSNSLCNIFGLGVKIVVLSAVTLEIQFSERSPYKFVDNYPRY